LNNAQCSIFNVQCPVEFIQYQNATQQELNGSITADNIIMQLKLLTTLQ